MNNYFVFNAVKTVKSVIMRKKAASAVIGEVLVMIVVVAMAALFKSGGIRFIQDIWTTMTTTASQMFAS
ncbi:unknown [Firmicutes bacterium CAG:882]|jgi:FlaG/FlaF family flagellin (archaellin)|nr:unknown [Firmicutes bacterium CAG:882]